MQNERLIKCTCIILCQLLLPLFFISCDSEGNTTCVTMKDGVTIEVETSIKYYNTEEDFIHSISFNFHKDFAFYPKIEFEYRPNEEYELSGYSQKFIGCWEKAQFGEWITQYGLSPYLTYYVCTKTYVQYVSLPPEDYMIVPKLSNDNMGVCPNIGSKTFLALNDNKKQTSTLITGVRFIGYDSHQETVNIELPQLNNIIWKFLIQSDGWE